jgi:hypothetical protein
MRFWYVQFKVVFLLGQTSPACCLIIAEYLCMESGTWSLIQEPLGSLLSTLVDPFVCLLPRVSWRVSSSFASHLLLVFPATRSANIETCCTENSDVVLSHQTRVCLVVQLETRPRVSSCFKSNLHVPAAIGSTMPLSDRSQSEHEHLLRLSIPLHLKILMASSPQPTTHGFV